MVTMINCKDHDNCSKLLYMSKNLYLIPGENIIKTSMLINGFLTLTEYRLYLIYKSAEADNSSDDLRHVSIPLNLIWKVEQLEFKLLRILTKLLGTYILSFDSPEKCLSLLKVVTENLMPTSNQSLFAFRFFKSIKNQSSSMLKNDKKLYKTLAQKEFQRMKFDQSWKITDVNVDFKICHSYPRYHIVPSSITNDDIRLMAEFRWNKRFPSVVWRSQKNGAVLIRCAQPQVGLMCWRNASDETFFKEVMKCLKITEEIKVKRLLIIDARHYSTAQFNRIRGGGVEFSEYYGEAEIMFMQLENIHSVRSSFDYISLVAVNSDTWVTQLESSYWLYHVSKLLKSASDITRALHEDGRSVIIHCSDGWDRTPQLTSLTQLLLDGYYRSIEGFQVLIEKEWLQFGHKFADRCAFQKPFDPKERSPVFVQWLDCIHQLICQYPRHFEFNDTFLVKLAIHVHSGLFGNFLYNTEEERIKSDSYNSTMSIWSFLSESNEMIINPLYYDAEEYQLRDKVIYPKYNTKFISPWNRLFFDALIPSDSDRSFSVDSPTKPFVINQVEEEISHVALSNNVFSMRKFKSDTDLSLKHKKSLNLLDEFKGDASTCIKTQKCFDFDSMKCNGRFINQASSTSTLNDPVTNGFINENGSVHLDNDIELRMAKDNKFQRTELVAFNGYLGELSNHKATKKDYDTSPRENSFKTDSSSMKASVVNKLEDQHFRLINLEDSRETYISASCAPCDLDGLYLSSEPVNELHKFWQSKFDVQTKIIRQLTENLNGGIQNRETRTDSGSTNERDRNEDSISSHDSYILLDSPQSTNNHYDRSIIEAINHSRISPKTKQSTIARLKLGNRPGYTFDSSDLCRCRISSSNPRKPTFQQCDTPSNGSEKAQA